MIEFKALCGHVLRARDEDAGHGVRCAHCGRIATVPVRLAKDGLKLLMEEIEESAAVGAARAIRPSRSILARFVRRWRALKPGTFDPFALVLKLCYGLGLFIILYVVVVKALPMWREDASARPAAPHAFPDEAAGAADPSMPGSSASTRARGLRGTDRRLRGVFVSMVPYSARVYCLEASRAQGSGPIWRNTEVRTLRADGVCPNSGNGPVVIDAVLPWNDPVLSRYPGYWEFRRAVEAAGAEGRREVLHRFFLPDDATDVFLDVTEDQKYIVRQFRGEATGDRLKAVHALFLPRILRADGSGFALEPVVRDYLPRERRYGFDDEAVRNELAYYGVTEVEAPWVMDALGRIGAIPCALPNGQVRFFKVGVDDGAFTAKPLE